MSTPKRQSTSPSAASAASFADAYTFIPTPVGASSIEMKEKLAEAYLKEHFSACNAMLWAGRLSPCFWADCIAYSNYLWNRCGNSHIGYETTPWTIATGEIPRWDKVKVFGCQCFEHIPNNQYYKVPDVPRGRSIIFVSFDRDIGWLEVF